MSRSERRVRRGGCPARAPAVARGPLLSGLSVSHPAGPTRQAELLELLGLAGRRVRGVDLRPQRRHDAPAERLARVARALPPGPRRGHRGAALRDGASRALGELDFDPAEIGVLVTAGYWSLGGPTLGHRLIEQLGLGARDGQVPRDRRRLRERGPAAAAGGPGAARSPGRARARRGRRGGLGFMTRAARRRRANARSSAPPCSATAAARRCSISAMRRPAGPEIVASAVHQVPGSLDQVRFMVSEGDSYMQLGRELPLIAETQPARARRRLPRGERARRDGRRPLAAASRRPRDPRGRAARPRAVGRAGGAQRGGAVRVRERGHGLELLRAQGRRGDARPAARASAAS